MKRMYLMKYLDNALCMLYKRTNLGTNNKVFEYQKAMYHPTIKK